MEEQIVDNEKFYCVCSDTNLAGKQIDNIANLKVNQLYYPSISLIPVHITKLIASGCCLQEISGVRFMNNLSYLDISNNFINNISDLQYLQNLQYLNITNNKIIFSQPLSALLKLQQLLLASNMIHDFDALATNPNFNIGWICPQNVAQIRNFLDYLGTKSTVEQATALMTQTISKRDQSPYHDPMLLKYAPLVVNKTLVIYNDQELRSVQFTDILNIETLFVFECYNLSFERVPTTLKKLAVNMCYKENINGLENMKSVIELSLRGNRISEIGVLSRMNQLQKLDIAQNNLESIRGIEQLVNLADVDLSENYLSEINSLMSMKQLKSINLSKNKITLAEDLQSLTNLTSLNISYNNLKSISFVKRMAKLLLFDASYNQISKIDAIKNLTNLVDLRLDGNMIESFSAIDSLPNQKAGWYTSEQKVHDSDNTRMIVKECVKFPIGTNFSFSDNADLIQFGFIDALKSQELTITNCPNISFENCPRIPIKLKINKCGLLTVTGIFEMQQIVELDLEFNNIRHINELEALVNLQTINLQNNDIYRINVLRNLKQLKSINLTNNKVIFSQPLNQLNGQFLIDNNLVTDNITLKSQKKPQLIDYQNFLGPNSTENQVKELAKINNYNVDMYFKFVTSIVNNVLQIYNDQMLTDFGFTSEMNIHTLNIQNCKNVKLPFQNELKYLKTDNSGALINYPEVVLLKAPNQITSLTIDNCELTNIVGIENMKQLQYLNLKDNQIVLIEQLQRLTNLKQVLVDNNFILDLQYLADPNWISLQKAPTDPDLKAYLTDTNSTLTLEAFKAQTAPKKAKSDQLIAQLLVKQDNDLRNKYQPATKFQTLYVENDSNIKDLKFAEQLDLIEIILKQCTNVRFSRNPGNLQYLSLQDCNISYLSGLQNLQQLKKLQITNSPLRSLSHISTLVNLLSLQITGSKLTNIVGISNLKQLQYLDLSENSIISIQPLSQLLKSNQFNQLYLDNNFITDLEWLVPNKDWICRQRVPAESDYQNYITDANLTVSVQQLKDSSTPLINKSNQLIQEHVVKYEQEMKQKYQNKINLNYDRFGPFLEISNDPEVRALSFVTELGVTDLRFENCPNARKIPVTIKRLQHFNSNLKTVKLVDGAVNLERLFMHSGNAIVNTNGLRALQKLKILYVSSNKVVNLCSVEYLKAKGCLGDRCQTGSQTQPSQQEIDESRLW
ncbi:leucine-rich_repeat domain-containing protein [Hexamita inflata]|uniref:Leucine-rich repeat domain-containing protein n=1 Tax=Hexamita inflata TaxID=28002 RepID=A0AA86PJS0_9EUKA|nr:leucine-rich repeat domain-containing protein [Hexamita inflata]